MNMNLSTDEKFVLGKIVRSLADMKDDPNLPSGIRGWSKSGCRGVWTLHGTGNEEHIAASISLAEKLRPFLSEKDGRLQTAIENGDVNYKVE